MPKNPPIPFFLKKNPPIPFFKESLSKQKKKKKKYDFIKHSMESTIR